MGHKTRKDRRKEYTGSKRFDSSCRCHGSCSWCEQNRTYQDRRDRLAADEELREWCGLAENQKPLPPEFSKVVDEHFWELF
jgi:hypothetical protein